MEKPIFTRVKIRNPFQLKSLPFIAKIYLLGNRKHRTYKQKAFLGLPFRYFFKLLYLKGLKGYGEVVYHIREQEKLLSFNARNTQFHSIYLPQYLKGYETATTSLFDIIIGSEDVFYDIGSNWGHFSLYVASHSNFKGQIHAFEPLPSSFNDLVSIVQQAGLQNIVTCHNIAFSNTKGIGYMDFPDKIHSGLATLSKNSNGIKVNMEKLDEIGLPLPDVIKVDAEESEDKIFEGARQLLMNHKPMIIFESTRNFRKPEETIKPFNTLKKLGYVFFHPVFLMTNGESLYALTFRFDHDNYEDLPDEVDLTLLQFSDVQRFLLDDQNVLACHKDKIDYLRNKFHH